ncbi:hypothetical protein HD554DRAFT_2040097 [Boletus coccyginus]|nr:hypothetical protein HD554DRAFT_2040097 [Boletus coccyginus]
MARGSMLLGETIQTAAAASYGICHCCCSGTIKDELMPTPDMWDSDGERHLELVTSKAAVPPTPPSAARERRQISPSFANTSPMSSHHASGPTGSPTRTSPSSLKHIDINIDNDIIKDRNGAVDGIFGHGHQIAVLVDQLGWIHRGFHRN